MKNTLTKQDYERLVDLKGKAALLQNELRRIDQIASTILGEADPDPNSMGMDLMENSSGTTVAHWLKQQGIKVRRA